MAEKKRRINQQVSYTISPEALEMLEQLIEKLNRSKSNLLDTLIREKYQETIPDDEKIYDSSGRYIARD